jgi:ribosomal protein L37E
MLRGKPLRIVDNNSDEIKCRKCGYQLRGLNERGVCPECGMSIASSKQAIWNRRVQDRHFFLKRFVIAAPCIYAAWVLACVLGGKGTAFIAWYPIYPLYACLKLLGIDSLSATGAMFVFYIGCPLFYAGVGAATGFIFDSTSRHPPSIR